MEKCVDDRWISVNKVVIVPAWNIVWNGIARDTRVDQKTDFTRAKTLWTTFVSDASVAWCQNNSDSFW